MDTEEDRKRRAIAASTTVAVKNPRATVLKQVLVATTEMGAASLIRVVRGIQSIGTTAGQQPRVPEPPYASRAAGNRCAATEAVRELTPADRLHIDEGLYWLAYAAAAYMHTPDAFVNRLTALGVEGASADSIVYAQWEPAPLLTPHMVVLDTQRKAIVVTVRGTSTLRDLIADMAAKPIAFAGGAGHTGMLAAMDGLLHYRVPAELGEHVLSVNNEAAAAMGAPPSSGGPVASSFTVPFVAALAEQAHGSAPAAAPAVHGSAGFNPYAIYADVGSVGLGGVAAIIQHRET